MSSPIPCKARWFAYATFLLVNILDSSHAQDTSLTGEAADIGLLGSPSSLTLDAAVAFAFSNNPRLLAKRKELGVAEAELQQASIYFQNNPRLSARVARRHVPGSTDTARSLSASFNPLANPPLSAAADASIARADSEQHTEFNIEISQEFEIFGQPRARKAAATAQREAVLADISLVALDVMRAARIAFYRVQIFERRIELLRRQNDSVGELRELSRRRFESGDIARTEYRQLEIQAAHISNALVLAEADAKAAALELKTALGLDADLDVVVLGEIPEAVPLPDFPSGWLENHPQLVYARLITEQRRQDAELIRRASKPNVTGSLFWTREETDTDIVGVGISVPIPLFNRGQGSIAAARARRDVAEAAALADARALEAWAENVREQYRNTIAAARSYSDEIVPMIEQNLAAIENAYQVGDIDLVDVRVSQRELFETQRAALDVLDTHYRWRAELEALAGFSLAADPNDDMEVMR